MSEMRITTGTENLPAHHSMAAIFLGDDGSGTDPLPETGPAGPGFEFGAGTEQRAVTADAVVNTVALVVPVSTCEGPFSSPLASHLELLRSQLLLPLLWGAFNAIAAEGRGSGHALRLVWYQKLVGKSLWQQAPHLIS